MSKSPKEQPEQLLHLVFGGELTDLDGVTFKDVAGLDIVGWGGSSGHTGKPSGRGNESRYLNTRPVW